MGAGGSQVHDFNPGEENGLFWTVPLPEDSVEADPDDGAATLELKNFEIDDYGNVGNALSGGHEIATARLSLQIDWSGVTRRARFVNGSLPTPFAASMAVTGATLQFTAVENGQTFSSQSNSPDFAMVASERNGVFFK
jgi:hypothetical protein